MILSHQHKVYFNNTFDVRWIWAGDLFLLIGGGSAVSQNSIYAIVADVAPESKRCDLHIIPRHQLKLLRTDSNIQAEGPFSSRSPLQRSYPRLSAFRYPGG